MSDHTLIVDVDGRSAIPIRAIPYITGWKLSPDKVAKQLARRTDVVDVLSGIQAFRQSAGHLLPILHKEWDAIFFSLEGLQTELSSLYGYPAEGDTQHPGYAFWRERSIGKLPAGVFVWQNEFEGAFARAFDRRNLSIVEECPGDRALIYAPILPTGVTSNYLKEGFPTSCQPIAEITEEGDSDEATAKPKSRSQARDEAILSLLRSKGYDPLAIPPWVRGKPSVRAEIKAALGNHGMWSGDTVFKKAWERLSLNKDIAYKK